MSQGTTTKTDFERWLNLHPAINDKRYSKIRCHCKQWGRFLRWRSPDDFNHQYEEFWLKNPDRWEEAYEDTVEDLSDMI